MMPPPSVVPAAERAKKCIGRVKYLSRNLMVRMSKSTRKVRPMP